MYVVMVTDLGAVKAKSGVACLALWSPINDRRFIYKKKTKKKTTSKKSAALNPGKLQLLLMGNGHAHENDRNPQILRSWSQASFRTAVKLPPKESLQDEWKQAMFTFC